MYPSVDSASLIDDGLVTPVVGDWAEEKYRLVSCYAEIFATSMKEQWQERVYIDLFAGAGRVRIRGTRRIIAAVPPRVLGLRWPFTRYVFCELDAEKITALEARVAHSTSSAINFVSGDSNSNAQTIASLIPTATKAGRVLSLCFADPYRLADLSFDTVRLIAQNRRVDFLVLVPSGMDATRNRSLYLAANRQSLDRFLGRPDWRDEWPKAEKKGQRFADFVVDQFGHSMRQIGYRYDGLQNAHLVTSTARRLPIYHLLMLSKHPLGGDFWDKCRKATQPQRKLF
jgi:three-Cys-motif partner protein